MAQIVETDMEAYHNEQIQTKDGREESREVTNLSRIKYHGMNDKYDVAFFSNYL